MSTPGRSVDPFRVFPVELMIEILHSVDDFYSLVSLTKVSLHADSVCKAYALPILNNLTKWYSLFHCTYSYRGTDLPVPIRGIFRCLALILSEPPSDIETVRIHFAYTEDCPWSVVPIKLCPERATLVAFELIHIAARIQRLACLCLLTMVGNLHCAVSNSKILGPERAAAFIPFSWVEEYRVYQALWNLQLYSIYFYYTQLKWGWSDEEAQSLSKKLNWQFHRKRRTDEEIPSVTNVLIQLGLTPKQRLHLPLFDFDEMEKILDQGKYPPPCVWSPPPTPPYHKFTSAWSQTPDDAMTKVSQATSQWGLIPAIVELFAQHSKVSFHLDGTERPFFQGMGLFIWDEWRMCSVGLACPNEDQILVGPLHGPDGKQFDMYRHSSHMRDDDYRRWWSLLGRYPWPEPQIPSSFTRADPPHTYRINDPHFGIPYGHNIGVVSSDALRLTFLPTQPMGWGSVYPTPPGYDMSHS